MIVGFDILGFNSKSIALSIKALNDLALWIVETFLWKILLTTDIDQFMIYQRLIHLLLFWIISKMVMHLGRAMEEVDEYFEVIHEAAGRKRLVETCDR